MQITALMVTCRSKTRLSKYIFDAEILDNRKPSDTSIINNLITKLKNNELLDETYSCNPVIQHDLSLIALDNHNPFRLDNLRILNLINKVEFSSMGYYEHGSPEIQLRGLNLKIYTNDTKFLCDKGMKISQAELYCDLAMKLFHPVNINLEWLKTVSPEIKTFVLTAKLGMFNKVIYQLPYKVRDYIAIFKELPDTNLNDYFRFLKFSIDLQLGNFAPIKNAKTISDHYGNILKGTLHLFEGSTAKAHQCYQLGFKKLKTKIKNKYWLAISIHAVFYLILELQSIHPKINCQELELILGEEDFLHNEELYEALELLIQHTDEEPDETTYDYLNLIDKLGQYNKSSLDLTCSLMKLIKLWCNIRANDRLEIESHEFINPLAHYIDASIALKKDPKNLEAKHTITTSPFNKFDVTNLYLVKEVWENKLDKITTLITTNVPRDEKTLSGRICWLVHPQSLTVEIMQQTINKNGKWSKGRAIALRRIYKKEVDLSFFSAQDLETIKHVKRVQYSWQGYSRYELDNEKAVFSLIGHPHVYHADNKEVKLELIKGEVELQIHNNPDGYQVTLSPFPNDKSVMLEQDSMQRFRVIAVSKKLYEISQIISEQGITIPPQAKDKLINLVKNADPDIQISTDFDDGSTPEMPPVSSCCMQLLPLKEGLKCSVWTRPFGDQGPYCIPGEGKKHIVATIENNEEQQRVKTIRDLKAEIDQRNTLLDFCKMLEPDENEWVLETPEECLETLSTLEDFQRKNDLRVEWPQGQTYRVSHTATSKQLVFTIKSNQQWFEYDGEVQLDNKKSIELKTLLELFETSNGRFIEVNKGEFIALSQEFKKQLDYLKSVSEKGKVFHLNAGALIDMADEADAQTDQAWQDHLKKLSAMKRHRPKLPTTLSAELRDYQLEGFNYLSRLNHWGVGACLADDMGLGKTVQAIALLLSQAKKGPALVVAPTSVCFNWENEFEKFSPSLNIHVLQTQERAETIDKIKKNDVLVCSYGLLIQMQEELVKKQWNLVVLDEAQAIKNPHTKRWKAAASLNANGRIALSGTPIENHLGELWSIFRFLNPGLLGSAKYFQDKFATPIERSNDLQAKHELKNIVSPYLLRRLKSDVLKELPSKTEQTILIQPSEDEIAFYDAVRTKALENIANTSANKAGTKRFTILAEITRLRQACCHSSLVESKLTIENSKITTFLRLVRNLKENNHKALVFSQFVRYLAIIQNILQKENITYQYIDGKTSPPNRKKAVTQFQSGEGDVFLLSLKAGGTGLNLTAADYVIHLDPWWNPAVEDQASDRAHRIGQERPVTIYRLVMQNSIEEKILGMHESKRDLADGLLSEGDVSAKISEKDLIAIISNKK
jgi:SNF2 family DNA or RNA helicase